MVDKRQPWCHIAVTRRRKSRPAGKQIAAYGLPLVKRLAQEGKALIHQQALRSAWKHFGWREDGILEAVTKLQIKHFYKHEPFLENPRIETDYYKARGLRGEDVYTHFHVEGGQLVISSFKRLEESR